MYRVKRSPSARAKVAVARESGEKFSEIKSSASERADADRESARKVFALTDPVILAGVMVLDAVVVFVGSIAAWRIYHEATGLVPPDWHVYVMAGFLLALTFLLRGLDTTIYGNVWGVERKQALYKTFKDFTQAFLLFVTFLVMTRWAVTYSRGSLVTQFIICSSAILAVRAIELSLLRDVRVRNLIVTSRLILIGPAVDIAVARKKWRENAENVLVVGAFPLEIEDMQRENQLALLSEFVETIVNNSRELKPDRIVLLLPFYYTREICFLVERLSDLPASIMVSTESLTAPQGNREALTVGGLQMLRVVRKPLTAKDRIIKRTFDLVVSSVLLLLLTPLLILVALAIRIDSPGKALFRQARKGFNQHQFRIFKFRTMRVSKPDVAFRQTGKNDRRITGLGKILRRLNIDELPQLLNVLRGEMSLVGPRPHAVEHDDMYAVKIASYARRHNIKPGITGLAQVNGCRGATETVGQMEDRINYDLTYIQNWSLLLDLKIILLTVFSVKAYQNAR